MLIRVRTNAGLWRVDGLNEADATVQSVLDGIAKTRPHVSYQSPLCSDPGCAKPIDSDRSLASQGYTHGSMVHCRVDPATCADATAQTAAAAAAEGKGKGGDDASNQQPKKEPFEGWMDRKPSSSGAKRIIAKDGSIQLVHGGRDEGGGGGADDDRGFRKGMLPLRDMKMRWTLQEFVDMDSKFTFKVKRQEESWVGKGGVSLETDCADNFQGYLRRFNFQRNRFGLLYGRFVDEEEDVEKDGKKKDDSAKDPPKNHKVVVEAIYEPPQEADPDAAEGFCVLDDESEDTVERLASMLGLRRVGWIFGHPPREEGFHMSAAEVIMAAEYQLEAAGGIEPTPFVTVKVTVGDDGNAASFEAFQVSRQCMEMVAEEALEVGPNPGFCVVNETFTAIQEGKESKSVENNFFLTVVPIVQHASDTFVSQFPRLNRDHDDRTPSHDELKRQLSKSGTAGWTFIDLLSDFHLLLYLCKFLDMDTDMPKICRSVVDRANVPLDDGYKIIIASMAGLDGSY